MDIEASWAAVTKVRGLTLHPSRYRISLKAMENPKRQKQQQQQALTIIMINTVTERESLKLVVEMSQDSKAKE